MLSTKLITFIFKLNKLDPNIFNTILELMPIQVKLSLLFPFLQFYLRFSDLDFDLLYIPLQLCISLFKIQYVQDKLTLSLILVLIGFYKLFVVLFFSDPFLSIKTNRDNLFL